MIDTRFDGVDFIYVPRLRNGWPYLAKLHKDQFVQMREKGWSIQNIIDGVPPAQLETADLPATSPMPVSTPKPCDFDKSGVCIASVCYSSQKCGARDENGNPKYE